MCSSTEPISALHRLRARFFRCESGQSTVEAAFALPVLMTVILLLVQPGIVLYDRIVMESAATEACRLLATTAQTERSTVEAFLRRRLSAVPEQDLFHRHSDGCTWSIEMEGCETTTEVTVFIANEVRPVPLIDVGAGLLGLTNANGSLEITVEVTLPVQPSWTSGVEGGLWPRGWVNRWDG